MENSEILLSSPIPRFIFLLQLKIMQTTLETQEIEFRVRMQAAERERQSLMQTTEEAAAKKQRQNFLQQEETRAKAERAQAEARAAQNKAQVRW